MIEEIYANRTLRFQATAGHPTARWRPHPLLLVGGSINRGYVDVYEPEGKLYASDWDHLRDDLGVASVLNLEVEQTDVGKGSGMDLCECGVLDHSVEYPPQAVVRAIEWAQEAVKRGTIYVHCHMGGGRSAAMAYAILCHVLKMTSEESLRAIQQGKDWCYKLNGQIVGGSIVEYPSVQWGESVDHSRRIQSIESALAKPVTP